MIFPTIHLNGTAGEDLLAENRAAAILLSKAIGALRQAAPNGRDYYVKGPDAISTGYARA